MPPAIAHLREIGGIGNWGIGDVLSMEALVMRLPSPDGKE